MQTAVLHVDEDHIQVRFTSDLFLDEFALGVYHFEGHFILIENCDHVIHNLFDFCPDVFAYFKEKL
jgi:hypothetical protein